MKFKTEEALYVSDYRDHLKRLIKIKIETHGFIEWKQT